MREERLYQSLQEFLKIEVPREIQAVLNRGGVRDRDWDWLRQEENDDENDFRPLNVLARADALLIYPSDSEKAFKALLVFRKAIALLSFIEGGLRILGLHFSIEIDGFVEQDEWYFSPAEWRAIEKS